MKPEGRREFQRVWDKQSTRSFTYEAGRLFADNYKATYYGYTPSRGPRQMYKLPREGPYDKRRVEDAMLYGTCMDQITNKSIDHRRSVLCLYTSPADSRLVQYHLDTGQVMQTVFLSPRIKFKHICWVDENWMFAVRSTTKLQRDIELVTGISLPKAVTLAVFTAYPIQFLGMFEVDRRVFGNDVINAMLMFDMLVVMHGSGHVRFYSFQYIRNKFLKFRAPLFEYFDETDRLCGEFPSGLPLNIHITEKPPVLLEVRCADQDIQIGGYPWHYLISPHGTVGYFEVYSLRNDVLAIDGELDMKHINTEPDRAVFHNDNSGRIIHIQPTQVRVLEIKPQNSSHRVCLCATIDLADRNKTQEDDFVVTSSGRLVKKRTSIDEINECPNMVIHQVDYEDELDLMWIATMYNDPENNRGVVSLHDNLTGERLKEVELFVPWKEYYEQQIYIDLDTIVHVTKVRPGKFFCFIYRLSGDLHQGHSSDNKPSKPHIAQENINSRRGQRNLRLRRL